ncbi:hypothetical protein [uncultured Porphyromonas sp.]|uniref:hypothetical protein n=1 Tax=uncultured Porphyromonas sp. TaxID=159274 RepID=UPI0026306A50|nr:hypothetical protein [uncultured Porphyromonas sp.]
MKKFLLLCSVALLTFSSCSKEKDEPIVKSNESEQTSINLHIEGEREDVPVADVEGRGLSLTADVRGNKITSVKIAKTESVKAILCLYTSTKGISREVTLPIVDGKISWRGSVDVGSFTKEELRDAKVSIFIGGDYTYPGDDKPITYESFNKAVRTTNGMNLSQFNPIFVSEGVRLTPGGSGSDVDFDSKGHRFRLFGQFVSVSFRNPLHGYNLLFNGMIVGPYASIGMILHPAGSDGFTKPTFRVKPKTSVALFYPFTDRKTISLNGPATEGGAETVPEDDPAYTIYIFTGVEGMGGIRFGKDKASGSSPLTTHMSLHNRTNLESKSQQEATKQGKFYNVVMRLKKK